MSGRSCSRGLGCFIVGLFNKVISPDFAFGDFGDALHRRAGRPALSVLITVYAGYATTDQIGQGLKGQFLLSSVLANLHNNVRYRSGKRMSRKDIDTAFPLCQHVPHTRRMGGKHGDDMKRAIYLDDRERELTRRVLSTVAFWLTEHVRVQVPGRLEKMAISWTRDEIEMLAAKFIDPTNETETETT